MRSLIKDKKKIIVTEEMKKEITENGIITLLS